MVDKHFRYFNLLPVDVQKEVWRVAMQMPRVHYLEMFHLDRDSNWLDVSKTVRDKQVRVARNEAGRILQELVPAQNFSRYFYSSIFRTRLTVRVPPFKIATPQVFTGNPTSCYFTNKPLLKRINRVAYETVKSPAKTPTKQQPAQIYGDLSGSRPTIPLSLTTSEDLVYLYEVMDNWIFWSSVTNCLEDPRTRSSITNQTKNIQQIMLSFGGGTMRRLCAGCQKLSCHAYQICHLTRKRNQDRKARSLRGVKAACKMCTKVQEQMKISSEPGEEATVREILLKKRKLEMLPQVQFDCVKHNYDIEVMLPVTDTESDDNLDDTVSICSADIDPEDHFGWYNNSRDFLIIDFIPHPYWPDWSDDGSSLPSCFVELSTTFGTQLPPPPPPATNGNTTADTPTLPSPLNPEQFHFTDPMPEFHQARGVHGTHWQCKWINIRNDGTSEVIRCFPDLVSLHIIDYDLTLRPDITELPAWGRRWLTGSHDSLFVEVVDPMDGTWVSDPVARCDWEAAYSPRVHVFDSDESEEDDDNLESEQETKVEEDERPALAALLEYVAWLRVFLANRFREDEEKGMPARKVDVAIVAYLVLDEGGKVDPQGRAKKQAMRKQNRLMPVSPGPFS